MKIGLIGLQNSGKTTIFNALTGLEAEITSYSGQKVEPNLGIVEVKDPRISKLAQMYEPRKPIYTKIEYIDFVGLSEEVDHDVPTSELLTLIKTTD
ncbi:MAG: 50S ribosome-binding GTPase, partial [Candidatus Cloacimonetes bacterium]|nr:50S ribosome-binding GTPase [Candidatus Cloacimonadota bacterium]